MSGASPRESWDGVERRETPRFPVVLAVELEHAEGWTRDVSASGVFFTTQGRFSPSEPIRFAIALEYVDPTGVLQVTCEGQIVRVEPRPRAIGVAAQICSYEFGRRETLDAMTGNGGPSISGE